LPDMVAEKVDEPERRRRWQELADIYLAQALAKYPPNYFMPEPTPERLLETVERFEEDLTDQTRVHRPIHAVIEVGEAFEVPPGRDRGAESDTRMTQVRQQLETMLAALRARRPQARATSAAQRRAVGRSRCGRWLRPGTWLIRRLVLRQIAQLTCALPAPPGLVWRYPGFPSLFVSYSDANAFFLSGHTAIGVVAGIEVAMVAPAWLA